MAIQRISTAHSDRLNPDQFWPQWDEDGYVEAANSQMNNARKAFQSGEAVGVQATGVVSQTMEGQTADAAMSRFTADGAKLEQRGGVHANNATINGLMAQNVANRKASINFVLANHEAEVEAIKTEAVATGAPQFVMEEKVAEADDRARTELQTIAQNSDQAHEELKGQLNAGEAPSVPSSMPGGPPGEGSPTLDGLDPEVQSSVGSAMGSGGGMDMSQMAGMAQGLLSPLTGALQSPPGADSLNQMGQQGFQMGQQALQQLLGQAGGGSAEITPEQVEELIAGQGGDSFDGNPEAKSDLPSSDGPKFENPEGVDGDGPSGGSGGSSGEASATPASSSGDGGTTEAASSSAPSPAAEPVSAAPPQSAIHPTTELSGDSNSAPASGAAGTGGAGASGLGSAQQQTVPGTSGNVGAPTQAADATGTQLSGSSAPTATSGSSLGAPGGLSSGAGLGAPAGGMGAMGGAPMAGGAMGGAPMAGGMGPMMGGAPMAGGVAAAPAAAPVPPAAPLAPAGPQAPTGNNAVPNATAPQTPAQANPAGTPTVPASTAGSQAPNLGASPQQNQGTQAGAQTAVFGAVPVVSPDPANAGRLYQPTENFSVQQRAAGTILAAISKQYARAGITSPIAVALLEDGTKVFCTADGLGYIPSGAHLPADTIPLAEFPAAQGLFRADWTGCLRPGYVLNLASKVGIIPPITTIIATDDIETEGVLKVTRNMLKGAPYIDCPITRDMFAKVEAEDAPLAMVALVQTWGFDPAEHDADEVALVLADSRWEVNGDEAAVRALAHYLLTDAHVALTSGQVSEAAYVLKQLLDVPTV